MSKVCKEILSKGNQEQLEQEIKELFDKIDTDHSNEIDRKEFRTFIQNLYGKSGKCEFNDRIEDEEQKIYYRCRKTNEEGNACEECLDEYELSEEGYCVDKIHCVEEEDGVCVKCKNNREYSSCLNKYFGCVPTSYMKCIECDNNLDFDICTKCRGDYKLTEDGVCVDIEDE